MDHRGMKEYVGGEYIIRVVDDGIIITTNSNLKTTEKIRWEEIQHMLKPVGIKNKDL